MSRTTLTPVRRPRRRLPGVTAVDSWGGDPEVRCVDLAFEGQGLTQEKALARLYQAINRLALRYGQTEVYTILADTATREAEKVTEPPQAA